jgi:dsRNA-specific ribonuclease
VAGVECCYIFKCRLEDYAQKAGIRSPVYQTTVEILTEGPPREKAFQSTVLINNAKYKSLPGFSSRKAAEQSAAEVALMEIGKSVSIPALVSHSLLFFYQVWLCLSEWL